MTRREDNKLTFAAKNARRRAYALCTDREKRQARLDRRMEQGAFGHAPKALYNHLSIGTTASPRQG